MNTIKRPQRLGTLAAGVLSVGLAACGSLQPRYVRPAPPIPDAWPRSSAATSNAVQSAASRAEVFADPRLRAVIAQALSDNRDLRSIVAAVEVARARYGIVKSARWPNISLSAGETYVHSGVASTGLAPLDTGLGGALNTSQPDSRSFSAGLGVTSFELDLFGRVKSLSDAERETYLASASTAAAARITLVGDVASAWLALGADLAGLALAEQAVKSDEDTLKITQRRDEAGVAGVLEQREADAEVQWARNDAAALRDQVAQDRSLIDLLVGAAVPEALLPGKGDWLLAVKAIDAPVASSVLLQRPDVLADEHRLAAAHADVAAARAAFFPQISLTVFGGYASSALSQLVSQRSRFDAIEDGISVPLFDGGFRRAQLRGTLATRKQAAALYQKTLQRAFKEVADLISDRTTLEAEVDADTRGVADTDAAYHLSVRRYEAGVGGFLDVLIEQRSLYQVQQRLTSTRLRLACNRVTLFKALGGGLDA